MNIDIEYLYFLSVFYIDNLNDQKKIVMPSKAIDSTTLYREGYNLQFS